MNTKTNKYVYKLNLLCGISHYLPCFPWFAKIWVINVSGKEREPNQYFLI